MDTKLHKLRSIFTIPAVRWGASYQREWLRYDVIAGVTLAAYAIPVSMAYATLAGLPPQHGIYCYLLGGLCYAAFGTSKQLAIGPTSAISLLVGTTIAEMSAGDAVRWGQIAALSALVMAVLSVLAWLLNLSRLVSFVSETILVGFKAGAALTIAMTQLPKLLGVPGGGEYFLERVWVLIGQVPQTNWLVLGIGLVALGVLLAGDRWFPGQPIALFVVVASTFVVAVTSLKQMGIVTVGELPSGLPAFTSPALNIRDIDGILPLGCACFLLAYIEGISAARTLAAKHDDQIDARQELLALGTANLAVAFGQGFPVTGGLSQSAVNDKAGAKSPLALVFASLALAACLLFLTGLLANLPTVVLAAVVLVAVKGLIDVSAFKRLWDLSRSEFRVAIIALIGVLLLGILKGVLLAAIVSVVLLIAGAASPHVAFLGRIPGSRRFSDLERHSDNEAIDGVTIFRPEGALLYFNVDHVRQVVWSRVKATPHVRLVICDLSLCPAIDVAGAQMLSTLNRDLVRQQVGLRIVEAHAKVRDLLRAVGIEKQVGYLGRHNSIELVLSEMQAVKTPQLAEPVLPEPKQSDLSNPDDGQGHVKIEDDRSTRD